MKSRMFPALLKYHRLKRGFSQLDLAVEAEVSARHVSFLESGRAHASPEMVLRLLSVLGIPLRGQNEALVAAGYEPCFPEPPADGLPAEVETAIAQMMSQHDPFPLTVLGTDGTVLRANGAAKAVFEAFAADPHALVSTQNIFTLFFDPTLWRPFVVDWEQVAHAMIARLHREVLLSDDARMRELLDRLLAFPDVPRAWRRPDFSAALGPTATFRLKREGKHVGFLVTVTTFSGPRDVTLDELRIESCFPLDAETRAVCERLTRERGSPPCSATTKTDRAPGTAGST
jgi:transcriptional regulator with XRE-family HTH domain